MLCNLVTMLLSAFAIPGDLVYSLNLLPHQSESAETFVPLTYNLLAIESLKCLRRAGFAALSSYWITSLFWAGALVGGS